MKRNHKLALLLAVLVTVGCASVPTADAQRAKFQYMDTILTCAGTGCQNPIQCRANDPDSFLFCGPTGAVISYSETAATCADFECTIEVDGLECESGGCIDAGEIGGDLTAGSVVFADGTGLQEDNSNLFWDDSNNRLGIGLATPADALDVDGNVRINPTGGGSYELRFMEGVDYVGFKAPAALTGKQIWTLPDADGAAGDIIETDGSGVLDWVGFTVGSVVFADGTGLQEDNANLFWDDSNNRLGLGTTSPAKDFHIVRDGAAAFMQLDSYGTNTQLRGRMAGGTEGSPAATPINSILFAFSANGHTGSAFTTAKGLAAFEAEELFSGTNQGTRFTLDTTAAGGTTRTEKLRIQGDGNVGIGTSSPESTLSIGTVADATDSYIQIDSESGSPPSGDCDADTERAREIFDHTNLVRCTCGGAAEGWLCSSPAGSSSVTRTTSASYNVLAADRHIFADSDSTAITVNLQAGTDGRYLRIGNVGTSGNDVTIDGNGGETVRGAATQIISDGEILILVFETTEGWW